MLSQAFSEVHAAVDNFKTDGFVRALRLTIVYQRIGGHLVAPSCAGPIFGRAHELSPDSLVAGRFANEPALDEPNRSNGVTTVGVRAYADFDEARQCTVFVLRDEYDCGKETTPFAGKIAIDFGAIFSWCYLGPKQGAEFCQFGRIRGFRTANSCGHLEMVARAVLRFTGDFNFATEFTPRMLGLLKWSVGAEGKFLTDEISQSFCLCMHCVNLPFCRM